METSDQVATHQEPTGGSPSSLFSRRELIRVAILAGAGTALGPNFSFGQAVSSGLTPAALGEDGSLVLSDPHWKPIFLNEHRNATLIVLGEAIIPATDTPGAKAALVNRYLDLLLSIQPPEFQRQFVSALEFIDRESQRQIGKNFRALSTGQQVWLLQPWAFPGEPSRWTEQAGSPRDVSDQGAHHFGLLKALIAAGFYSSEIGEKELGSDGEITHGPYLGCEHPTGTHG